MTGVVALDVGGTGVKAALVGRDGTLSMPRRRPTGRERGPAAVVETILDFAAEMVRAAPDPPRAVGVASPGIVDEAAGVSVFSSTVGWRDVPLRALLEDRLGLPVVLSHDVRAGGVAEGRIGAGRDAGDFLFVPIGTSIGAAVMIGGHPYAGAHRRGGEVGHLVVRLGGDPCGCGQRGCVDTLASGAAIARRYAALTGRTADAAEVARRAAGGEPAAVAVWQDAVDALADGLLVCTTLLDPSTMVLGGGLAQSGEMLLAPLRDALARRITFQVPPRIVGARLGEEAGCIGAGLLAWDLLDRVEGTRT